MAPVPTGHTAPSIDLGPAPLLGYTDSTLIRAAERRTDAAHLAAAERDAGAGAYAVAGDLVVLRRCGGALDPLFSSAEARDLGVTEVIFLGLDDGKARFGMGIDPAAVEGLKQRTDVELRDLRSIATQGLVGSRHFAPLAEAKAMLHWHARHRFCAVCGTATVATQAGWKRECPGCKAEHFPRTDPVVIMLAIDGDRCLLGRQARFVANTWSCLAGFVEPGETVEEAARREILEESGVVCGRVTYFRSQPWPFPMSLMIGCHAVAETRAITVDTSELEDARWFDRAEAAQMLMRTHPAGLSTPPPVAIAHHIIRAFVERGSDVLG